MAGAFLIEFLGGLCLLVKFVMVVGGRVGLDCVMLSCGEANVVVVEFISYEGLG